MLGRASERDARWLEPDDSNTFTVRKLVPSFVFGKCHPFTR